MDDFPEIPSYNNLLSRSDIVDEKLKSEKFKQFLQKNTKKQNFNQIKRFSLPQNQIQIDDRDIYVKIMVK